MVALHLTVVHLTCNENGDPDILLLARFHAQSGGVDHGSHNGILPQSALPCQRPNRPAQYRYPFAEGTAVHLPRVPEDVQRHQRHRVVPPAHRGRDGEPRGDVACPWVPRASDCGGVWSCTCFLRINTPGSSVDRQRTKKVYTRGPSWPPSGPLTPGDALTAGRADARRRLRSPPLAASHHPAGSHPCWLRPRRHAEQEHLPEGPDMVGHSRRHGWCLEPPAFGG